MLWESSKCSGTLLGENVFIATYFKVNQLVYDSFSQKYQVTPGQELIAFDGIFFSLYSLKTYAFNFNAHHYCVRKQVKFSGFVRDVKYELYMC